MKLLLVNPNTSIAITEAMLAIARDAAAQGVLIEGLTARFGAPLIVDPATLLVAEQAVPDIVLQHIDETFSGVIVSAFGDPGVIALRHMLEIPVTGIAEASMLEAAAYGRFSIVTTTPELIGSIEAAARR